MQTKIGIDIVLKSRFQKSLKTGKDAFQMRVFTPQELRQNSKDQLASIFCMKEAVIKALELPADSWLFINTNRKENGKVECSFLNAKLAQNIISLDTSISHEREWIIGAAIVLVRK